MAKRRNVVLIGMPGAGKSTIGVLLAKRLALAYVDTDLLIQERAGCTLQDIVDRDGHLALRRLEEQVLADLELDHHVIATGGSAVYSDAAMEALARGGHVVYLEVDLPTLERRVTDLGSRGIARPAGHSFADVYAERVPLYERWAEIRIPCTGRTQEEIVDAIVQALERTGA